MKKSNYVFLKRFMLLTLLITFILSLNITFSYAKISIGGTYKQVKEVGLNNSEKNKILSFVNMLSKGINKNDKGEIIMKNIAYSTGSRSVGYNFNYNNFKSSTKLSFDCSSFVSTVYHEALGKKMTTSDGNPYTTYVFRENSYNNLSSISMSSIDGPTEVKFKIITTRTQDRISYQSLEVGDIILNLDGNTPRHVVLYIGSGKYMHTYPSLGSLVIDNDKTNPSNCSWYLSPKKNYSKIMVLRPVQAKMIYIPASEPGLTI